jgi:anti-anti-sigma factor
LRPRPTTCGYSLDPADGGPAVGIRAWPVLCLRRRVKAPDLRNAPLGPDPALASEAEGGAMAGVELNPSVEDGHVVVALRGDLDVTGTGAAEAAITALVVRGQSLVIDMSGLDFMDCCSLGALLRVQRLAWRDGGDVVLAAPQRQVLRLLDLTGNDGAFSVHASVAAAVAGMASGRRRYSWRRLAVRAARPGRAAPSRTGAG